MRSGRYPSPSRCSTGRLTLGVSDATDLRPSDIVYRLSVASLRSKEARAAVENFSEELKAQVP